MPAIPIDAVDQDEEVDPESIRRRPVGAIPLPGASSAPIAISAGPRRGLAVGGASENPMEIPSGVIGSTQRQVIPIGSAPRPQVMSSGGIPVTPQTPKGIIPVNPASRTGEAEQVNNKGIPIKAGIAGLWAKADNIHNPVLRVLGKIGTGALKAIDYAGEAALPSVEQRIPGSEGNERLQENRKLAVDKETSETAERDAQTAHLEKETAIAGQPKVATVGTTPEEQTLHDLMTGESGGPRVNPETGKPYSYLEAYQATKQAEQDTKPVKPATAPHINYDSGIPVSVTAGEKVFDVNDPKLPAELKPLVDAANRAHSQKVKEGADTQARSFAAATARADNSASRQDIREHDKAYVQPAEAVEKSYQMMDAAYKEYEAARKQGKELPTGAQSMLALSTHLSTTFGNVKGARVTKDMIHEHLGARSISDDMLVAVQKFTNGDQLSPSQWKAFHDLISQSRKLTWDTATKQANRKGIPVDFLPEDLQSGGGSSAPPTGAKVRDYTNVGSK